ncbi:MAG: hypothetical protein ACYDCH_06210 [Gaiellaceae bacterium]
MRGLVASTIVALACTALLGIQQTVRLLLAAPPDVTTAITAGAALLAVWAIVTLRAG